MKLLTDHEITDIEERAPIDGMDLEGLAVTPKQMVSVWARDMQALLCSLRQEREAREAAEILAEYHRDRADSEERGEP